MYVTIPHYDDAGDGPWWLHMYGPPLLHCGCGYQATMDNHVVEADGTVKGSILCPDCGWHVWGRLEGWGQ